VKPENCGDSNDHSAALTQNDAWCRWVPPCKIEPKSADITTALEGFAKVAISRVPGSRNGFTITHGPVIFVDSDVQIANGGHMSSFDISALYPHTSFS
jgi:hypothetical protein